MRKSENEKRLRSAYVKTLELTHKCVWELAEIRDAALTLRYLTSKKFKMIVSRREASRVHSALVQSLICRIVIRTYAICFDGGRRTIIDDREKWISAIERHSRFGHKLVLSDLFNFLMHEHEEAKFILEIAAANNVFGELTKTRLNEVRELAKTGSDGLRFEFRKKYRIKKMRHWLLKWKNIGSCAEFKRFNALRHEMFAHNIGVGPEWIQLNRMKVKDLIEYVLMVWSVARQILNLLIYDNASKGRKISGEIESMFAIKACLAKSRRRGALKSCTSC